ncbi:MAG: BrnT family toxin [Candidatus Acidiferrales bacterium]
MAQHLPTQTAAPVTLDTCKDYGYPVYVQDESFSWDDEKAAQNWRDHGVTFEMAREMFKDPFAIEWVDTAQDMNEERYAMIGMVENRLLFVAYTMREERTHIISARKAEPYERRKYHEENREA